MARQVGTQGNIRNKDLNIKEINKGMCGQDLSVGKMELQRAPARHKLNLSNTRRFPLFLIVGCYNIFKISFQESPAQSSD